MNLNSVALQKILPLLALRPDEGHTLTDLMKFSGLDSRAVWQVLEQLQIERSVMKNLYGPKTYSINPGYKFYSEIKIIAFRLLNLPERLQADQIDPDLIILYGSIFREVFRKESDIDLLVIGRDEEPIRKVLYDLSIQIGKTINFVFYTPKRFAELWNGHNSFIETVFSGPHTIITGSFDHLDLLGEL